MNWQQIQKNLSDELPAHIYSMWIAPIRFVSSDRDAIVLSCPNNFSKEKIIADGFLAKISGHIKNLTGLSKNIILRADPSPKSLSNPAQHQLDLPKMRPPVNSGRSLCPDFIFSKFIPGPHCEYAYAAAVALANQSAPEIPGLFLLSSPGNGKTHLCQAIGAQLAGSKKRVFYNSADDFATEMVAAYKSSNITNFKTKYRCGCDVLILEDFHLLAGKTKTQEELALILDNLHESGRKCVFSSPIPISDIPLSATIKSKISQYPVTEITRADFDTRIKILEAVLSEKKIQITGAAISLLASELTENIRILKSGLFSMMLKSTMLHIPPSSDPARDVIRHLKTTAAVTPESIKKLICQEFNISPKDVESRSRKQSLVIPRNIGIFLSRRHTTSPMSEISKAYNRNRATAIHAINAIEKELKRNSKIARQLEYIETKMQNPDRS